MARIDAPLLDNLNITFFHQLIFVTPQLVQFIGRTPKFKDSDIAYLNCLNSSVRLSARGPGQALQLSISCRQTDWQLLSVAQVCMSSSGQALIPTVKRLEIMSEDFGRYLQDDIENSQWLEIFPSFTAVEDLSLN